MRARIASRLFEQDSSDLQHIAHYEVLRRIGSGGMGVVYAARDAQLERVVALKLVRRHSMSKAGQERLIREARTLAKLSHPNIVQVYEVGEHEGDVYIAMEFIEGETLHEWSRRRDPALSQLLAVFRAAGAGLAAAHAAGIVHRDFKPTNVLVGDDGRVRVVDFGLARWSRVEPSESQQTPESSETPSGLQSSSVQLVGTPGYIAPELLDGHNADSRSDQFALCVSFWEAITGNRPGPLSSGVSVVGLRPRWLRKVLARGLASDPARRWPNIDALLRELDRRPRRLRRAGLSVLGLGLAAGFASSWMLRAPIELCPDSGPSFDRVWNDERRARLQASFAEPGADWLRELDTHLNAELMRQRDAWVETRAAVCRSTWIDKTRSEAAFDRANVCLDRHLDRVDALLVQLHDTDPAALAGLDRQLDALGDPRRCAESSRPSPPIGQAARITSITRELDRLEFLFLAGGQPQADQAVARLVQMAAATTYDPLLMDALALQSRIGMEARDYETAAHSGFEANLAAERCADDIGLFDARRHLVAVHANLGEDRSQTRQWIEQAEATFVRLGEPEALQPELLDARSELAVLDGDFARAELSLRQAIEVTARLPDALGDRWSLELSLANVLADHGQPQEAREIYMRYRDARSSEYGPAHPHVGLAEFNLCLLDLESGDTVSARPHCERALQIQSRTYGELSLRTHSVKTALAKLALLEQDYAQAIALAESIWQQQSRLLPRSHTEYGNGLELLATAQLFAGHLEAALESTEQLAALGLTGEQLERAEFEQNLGWLRCRVRACADAQGNFETAIELGAPTVRAFARNGLANVALVRGDARQALEHLDASDEAAVSADELGYRGYLAERAWLRAWALHELGENPARVRELVDTATEIFAETGASPDMTAKLAEIRQ